MKFRPTADNNFIWLLGVLLLLMFCDALLSQLHLRGAHLLVNISLILTVIIAVWTMRPTQSRWFGAKVALAAAAVLLMVADGAFAGHGLAPAVLIALTFFVVSSIYIAWQQVMFTGEITRNTIFGAICIYFLLGLFFGFTFLLVEYFSPGSMNGLDYEHWQGNLEAAIYYSMVTLTTLGYGDITPAAPLTRFLAYMEAAIGVFYTTVLVASLIGMRLSTYEPKKSE